MSIVTYNNRSIANISAIPGAAKSLTLIKTLTASSSSTLSLVNGSSDVVFDSTYPIYLVKFINIHPSQSSNNGFQFQATTDGSNFNTTLTSTFFRAYHFESPNGNETVGYQTAQDKAQSTDFQRITHDDDLGNDNDSSGSGELMFFNPSSTTFVKHFFTNFNHNQSNAFTVNVYVAGYFNTTSAITGLQFKMGNGNVDSGTIKLYGIKGT